MSGFRPARSRPCAPPCDDTRRRDARCVRPTFCFPLRHYEHPRPVGSRIRSKRMGIMAFHDALIAEAGRIVDGGRSLPLISDPSNIDIDRASDTPVASLVLCQLALSHAKGSIRGPPRPIPPQPREKRWLPRPEVPSLGRQPNPCPQPRFRRWSTDSALHRSRDFATTTRFSTLLRSRGTFASFRLRTPPRALGSCSRPLGFTPY